MKRTLLVSFNNYTEKKNAAKTAAKTATEIGLNVVTVLTVVTVVTGPKRSKWSVLFLELEELDYYLYLHEDYCLCLQLAGFFKIHVGVF